MSNSEFVNIELCVQNEILDVAKIGPERLVLRHPRALAAGDAELILTIGKSTKSQTIMLNPDGTAPSREIKYW